MGQKFRGTFMHVLQAHTREVVCTKTEHVHYMTNGSSFPYAAIRKVSIQGQLQWKM